VVHPDLEIEDDVRELMSTHKELASLLLQDPDPGYRYGFRSWHERDVPQCPP